MPYARPVMLRHQKIWGASIPGHDIKAGDPIVVRTRKGVRRITAVKEVVHRAEHESIVSLVSPGKLILKTL